MSGYTIAAGDHYLDILTVLEQRRSCVGVGRFSDCLRRPLDLPNCLTGLLVDAHHIRRIVCPHTVKHLNEQRVFKQERRRCISPVETELAIILLHIARPQLCAAEVERLEDAGTGHHPDVLAIGDRRRRGHVLLTHFDVAGAEMLLPDKLALCSVDTPQIQVVPLRDVQKDAFAPDDWRSTGPARHSELPGDVLFSAPSSREVLFAAYAV